MHFQDYDVQSFGRFMRNARRNNGMTLRDVAERLGVSVSHVSDMERGRRAAPLKHTEVMRKLMEIYTCTQKEKEAFFLMAVASQGYDFSYVLPEEK